MKGKLAAAWLLLVVFAAREARGQLQCYVCENCPDPFDGSNFLQQSCPLDSDTTTTTIVPPPGETTILTPPPLPTNGEMTTITPAPLPSETPPVPQTPVITPPPLPGRRKRQVPNGYRCYRIEHANVVRRGCASFLSTDTDTCQSVNGGTPPTACKICDWDGCNSAAGLRVSLFALLLATLLNALLKH
uniref:Protein sleepless n=1 Tax=Anopheles atroparvus TaxID=41427 RepID=A0A182ISN6_ANOAO